MYLLTNLQVKKKPGTGPFYIDFFWLKIHVQVGLAFLVCVLYT